MVERASFFHHPRPFKDPHWQRKKDAKGKPRNLKQVLQAERDRCPRRILESGEFGEALGCESSKASARRRRSEGGTSSSP